MLLALHPCHLGWHWCLLQTFPIDSNDFLLISQRVLWPPLPPPKQGKAISAGELTFQEYSQHSTERIYWISSSLLCVCVCVCMCVKSFQLCLPLCNHMDCSPPGSSAHGILQARIGVGFLFLIQGTFSMQGSNLCLLGLLHWQAGTIPRVPPGKPNNPWRDYNHPVSESQEW